MLIDIEVTQSMIDAGQERCPDGGMSPSRCLDCPLALAFQAAGFQDAKVGITTVEIGDFRIPMPEDMYGFRRSADSHYDLQPSKFKIEIPDSLIPKVTAVDLISKFGPCAEAVDWLGDKTLEEAWAQCEYPDWMLWLVAVDSHSDLKKVAELACKLARQSLQFCSPDQQRSALAIQAAEGLLAGTVDARDVSRNLDLTIGVHPCDYGSYVAARCARYACRASLAPQSHGMVIEAATNIVLDIMSCADKIESHEAKIKVQHDCCNEIRSMIQCPFKESK